MAISESTQKTIRAVSASNVKALQKTLDVQTTALYEVMGIVALAADAIRDEPDRGTVERCWAALDGAHKLLDTIADQIGTCGMLLTDEVAHV